MRPRPQHLILLAFLAALPAQQRTLVVDRAQGPYHEISDALLYGRPGDRIEVHSTTTPYNAITVSYGVEIIADPGTPVNAITIQNLSSAHAVRIDGLQIPSGFYASNPMIVRQCQGIVHLHQVNAGGGIVADTVSTLTISNSATRGNQAILFPFYTVYAGLSLTSTRAVVSSSSITGGIGTQSRGRGGPGILLYDSDVVLADCTVVGGEGGSISDNLGCSLVSPGDGGDGIVGAGAWINRVVAVGTGSIAGGPPGCCICPANSGIGISNVPGASIAPGVTVSYANQPVVGIAEPPHLTMPLILQQGGSSNVGVTGTTAQSVLLGIDIWNGYQGVSGVVLPFMLTPAATLYAFAPPGPGASVQFSLSIPAVAWLLQQFVHVQAVTVAANGRLAFSNGSYGRIR